MNTAMSGLVGQGGREITQGELKRIQETVQGFAQLGRRELAATVCEHMEWFTASGTPKVQACMKFLEELERQGRICLPKKRLEKAHVGKRRLIEPTVRTAPAQPIEGRLRDIEPVRLEVVRLEDETRLWKEYMQRYHPLGYKEAFGHRLRYFIRSGSQPLGCLFMGGAAKAIAVRDQWIGWSPQRRMNNLPWVINNTRFLIFPWVHINLLASHVLGQLARRVEHDWEQYWGFSPLLMETFVDPRYYRGTCYRAAGWVCLGETSGRGLARPGESYCSTPRLVLVKPLHRAFRQRLCDVALHGRVD